jgi:hypothetical protein
MLGQQILLPIFPSSLSSRHAPKCPTPPTPSPCPRLRQPLQRPFPATPSPTAAVPGAGPLHPAALPDILHCPSAVVALHVSSRCPIFTGAPSCPSVRPPLVASSGALSHPARFGIWPIVAHVNVIRYCGEFSPTLVV